MFLFHFSKKKLGKVTKNVRQLLFLRNHLKLKMISSVNKPKHFPKVVIRSVKELFFVAGMFRLPYIRCLFLPTVRY